MNFIYKSYFSRTIIITIIESLFFKPEFTHIYITHLIDQTRFAKIIKIIKFLNKSLIIKKSNIYKPRIFLVIFKNHQY